MCAREWQYELANSASDSGATVVQMPDAHGLAGWAGQREIFVRRIFDAVSILYT